MTKLQPHQQRVIDEKNDLEEKLNKLKQFTSSIKFTEMVKDVEEQKLLIKQQEIMNDYLNVLIERINNF